MERQRKEGMNSASKLKISDYCWMARIMLNAHATASRRERFEGKAG